MKSVILTKNGRQYLKTKMPFYKQYRPWHGRLYLITYDISEKQRAVRDNLRQFLKDQGAKLIQQSVWISAYDLTNKITRNKLVGDNGVVLVSSLKQGVGVGREKIDRLIQKLYRLDKLNDSYNNFIKIVVRQKELSNEGRVMLKMMFLSILKDDPQLPRALLPANWQGDKAYKLYTNL